MAHGVTIEGTEEKEKCHDCFHILVLHDWASDLRQRANCINTKWSYHHYNQHRLLPLRFKTGPDVFRLVRREVNLIVSG